MVTDALLQQKTKSIGEKNRGLRMSSPFAFAKRIGIVFTIEDVSKHNAVKHFIQELKNENKEVETLAFLPKGNDNHEFLFKFFTSKDFDLLGRLKNPYALEFIELPFDFLFCLDFVPNVFVNHILAQSKAKCRVGNYTDANKKQLELLIKPRAKKYELLNTDLLHYVKTFT